MTPRRGWGAPMPDEVRALLRAGQHPARAVDCPWCGAHDRGPCVTKVSARRLVQPHPARISAWVRSVACCPTCQVELGVECRTPKGWPLPQGAVHDARAEEAEVTT